MFAIGEFIIEAITRVFTEGWRAFVIVLINGGWVLLAMFLLWVKFIQRWRRKEIEYLQSVEWVFLSISIPDTASPSIMSAEQVFTQIHATKKNYDWREKWILGRFPLWFSFEIVSLGGIVKFIIRTPKEHVDTVKSAFFAQYPDAEINEVGDYMDAFKLQFNPDEADYDIWGTDLTLEKHEGYPIKTYPLFEHTAADTIIDPLAALIEVLSDIDSEELVAIQLLALPSGDEWKEEVNEIVKKLKGAPPKGQEENRPPSLMQHLSDKEKDVINAIQTKLGKLSFQSKVRFLYAAPKDKIKVNERVPAIMGAFSQFSTFNFNSFKPNKFTTTKIDILLSEKYEAQAVSRFVLWRKRWFLRNFKDRELSLGGVTYHMSTEELASLFHFPLEEVRTTAVGRTEARKGEAPINLPM